MQCNTCISLPTIPLLSQMCSSMLSVMTICPPCSSVLLSCCWLDHVRSVTGEHLPSFASPCWPWPCYLLFIPSCCALWGVRRVGSVVTLPFSWLYSQHSVVRWRRGGCWGVCQSGFFPGSCCCSVCCCCPLHPPCFTSVLYASDTTVSLSVI